MASVKQQVRLLLDDPTAHALYHLSLRESRSLAGTCMVLIKESLASRRAAQHQTLEVQRLAQLLKTPSDATPND
jgi:hypothetical protein